MKSYGLALCFLMCVFGVNVQGSPHKYDAEKGYYWRDYDKHVPSDAFPGGIDKRGKPTYIGQTFYTGCKTLLVLPGQILEAQQKMIFEWGSEEHETTSNIQILCSRNPELFEWVKTNISEVKNLKGLNLVSGGIEKNYTVYIGRVSTEDQILVGRVLLTNVSSSEGLYTTVNGQYLHVFSSFDVLTYKLKKDPSASGLRSPNASPRNAVWQPVLAFVVLWTLRSSWK